LQVPPKTLTTALLAVQEEEFDCRFQVKSYLYGRVAVKFYSKKKDNLFLSCLNDDVFYALKNDGDLDFSSPGKVSYTTEGRCMFRYGIQQSVDLSEEPLPAGYGTMTDKKKPLMNFPNK